MAREEVLREFDVRHTDVVAKLLVANNAEAVDVDGTTLVEFGLRPLGERLPDSVVGLLGDDAPNVAGVATEVPLDSLVAETRNIEVQTGGLLPAHCLHTEVGCGKYGG